MASSSLRGVGLEDVGILASDGVDAEVPDAEIDGFVGDDLHEGELAELQVLFGVIFIQWPPGRTSVLVSTRSSWCCPVPRRLILKLSMTRAPVRTSARRMT